VFVRKKGFVSRKFQDQEIQTLYELVAKAERSNAIMNPTEQAYLEDLIRSSDPEFVTNTHIMEYFDRLITNADEIDASGNDKVTKMEGLKAQMEAYKIELQQSSVAHYNRFM
jgi:hypothetical protein